MAGTDETAKKQQQHSVPMSLNQRHSRFIQDLSSSSHTKPRPLPAAFSLLSSDESDAASSAEKFEEGSRYQCSDTSSGEDDVPNFSGIAEFDSPLDDSEPGHLKDQPFSPSRSEGVVNNIPTSATFNDRDEKEKEDQEKATKIRIAGRRRLCKMASKRDDSTEERDIAEDQPSDITDFCSPLPVKTGNKEANDIAGGNEIRDILSDLSARLEYLSIEKKPPPKIAKPKAVSIKEELGGYASADSSFSNSSRNSGSSSDDRNHSNLPEGADKAGNGQIDESDEEGFVGGRGFGMSQVLKSQNKGSVKPRTYDLDEEDKGNDFVTHTDDKLAEEKKINHQSTRDDKRVVEILEEVEEAERSVSKEDHSITLKGLRYTYNLPSRIGKMLYPHQREGLKWLWSLHCLGKGGILGDDMGLGKTMQICGYLAGLFHSRLTKRIMVVAPKTLIPHWIKELSVVGLSKKIKEYFGTCPKARQYELEYVLQNGGILLTTYDIVRNNCKRLCDISFQDDESEDEPLWDYMVLDEGHLIKNPSTQRAQSLLAIPCAHRIIISGTPLQNNLKELWALFNFCCPDLLGDKKWFKEHYENPILRGNEKRATERDRHVGSTVAKKLREHIQPYFLRRMKSEIFSETSTTGSATLSNKNEVIVWLKLTQCQRHLYEAFLKSELVLSAFDGSPLAAITVLKKICDHPYLLTKRAAEDVLDGLDSMANVEDRDLAAKLAKRFAEYTEDEFEEKQDNVSCKISFILQLLENLIPEGHSVLIFSQTRKMLDIIQELLETNGFKFLRIDGTTKISDRQKIVNDFQEGRGAPIFMLTSQVGGLGLTLTRADRVIVVDPAWNPSTDNQSVDRAYRIGQNKDVLVYRLMTCGTIEEKIYRMQIFKGGLFKTATEHKEQTRYFSQQDLKELFSLPKDGFDISLTQQQLHEEHGHQIALNDTLKEHLKFLESIGIGGVSHHSLLYSKTEPTPRVEEEELTREAVNCSYRYPPARVQERPVVDGPDFVKYAFNPKDVKALSSEKRSSPCSSSKLTESDIKAKISRFSQILSNKSTVSKLPDGGRKIQKQIEELYAELNSIRTPEVINLEDDVADVFHRSLYIDSS